MRFLLICCMMFASSANARVCVGNGQGDAACFGNGKGVRVISNNNNSNNTVRVIGTNSNANTVLVTGTNSNSALVVQQSNGVNHTMTSNGGEAYTKNGKGVVQGAGGTTCVRTANFHGCR